MSKRHQHSLFLSLDSLVPSDHPYRHLDQWICFAKLSAPYHGLYANKGRKEKGVEFGLRALVLPFMEDLSDREMERCLQENKAGKWFCELSLGEKSPDHSYFGDFRKRLGTCKLMEICSTVRDSLKNRGLIREVLTLVDASQLVSQWTTWDDRDKAINVGLEKFNNDTASKVAADKQARFGCQGNKPYWFGYKKHVSVDMPSGLINKAAASSAEVTDAEGVSPVCPTGGAVFGDKGYGVDPAQTTSSVEAAMMPRWRNILWREKIVIKTAGSVRCDHRTSGSLPIAISVFVIGV